jgi:hypothetical protein
MGRIRFIKMIVVVTNIPVCLLFIISTKYWYAVVTHSLIIKSIMVPTTRSQIRNDNTDRTPAAASVNNNPITTQNIIMVQTEAERLAAIVTVATAAANAAAAAVPPVVLDAQPVVQPVIQVPIGLTYLLGSKLCDADVEAFFRDIQ